MPKISLVVCTLAERRDDIQALLHSLVDQAEYIEEIILVDQHPDPLQLLKYIQPFLGILPIRHKRTEKGLSRARNYGLPLVSGALVAFPDDDCVYPSGLLKWIVEWFRTNASYDILAVGVKDIMGVPSGNRWPQQSCEIRTVNAFRTTFSSSLFLRASRAKSDRFDSRLGVGSGTPYGSGEETDYVLRLIRTGGKARFDRTRHIIHPRRDMLSGTGSSVRAQSYGFGMGHLLQLHSLRTLWAGFMAYNIARAGIALAKGNLCGSCLCLAQTRGIWKGYLSGT